MLLDKVIEQAKEINTLENKISELEAELTTAKQQLSEARIKNVTNLSSSPQIAPAVP